MTQRVEPLSGWSICTIGDVVSRNGIFVDGDWVESKDQDPNGEVRLIQLADIGDGEFLNKSARFLTSSSARNLSCTYLKEGDLLIARMPDPLGRCCLFPLTEDKRYVTVVDVCVVRLASSRVYSKYMMYLINSPSVRADIAALQSGSTRKRISRKNLATISLPLAPLNEQHRVVAKIEELFSELDKGIESLKTAGEQLKVYRQAVLKHAFEGNLTAKWREENAANLESSEHLLARIHKERKVRYEQQLVDWKAAVKVWEASGKDRRKPSKPSPHQIPPPFVNEEIAVLPQLPNMWSYHRLSEIAQIGSRGHLSVSKDRKLADPIEVPYLRVANVQRGALVLDEIRTMLIEKNKLDGLRLEPGDVLFNEGGDRDKLGRGWIWEGQIEPCITQNHVFRATTYLSSLAHSKFISHWGNTFGRDYFEKGGKQTTNLASINKTVLSMFPIPIPALDEQEKIIEVIDDVISVIESLEEEVENGLAKSDALRQSVLKKAFSGQLVAQDPDDEPASVLIARIQAGKAKQEKPTNPSKKKKQAKATV